MPLLGGRLTGALEEQLEGIDPEHRLSAAYVHGVVAAGREGALGLRVSEHMALGDGGLLDFLMTSAPTPRAALALAHSHMRLLSDVHQPTLLVDGAHARWCMESRVEAPRALDDFLVAFLLRNHVLRWHASIANDLTFSFRRGQPKDSEPYRRTFGAAIRFEAAATAIGFPAWYLDVPLPHRNRRLHAVLRRAADDALSRLPAVDSSSERVRAAITEQLAIGRLSLASVARTLGQHPRTLSRALLREGTTFQALVARARRDAALHWLGKDLTLAEVARRSGFHSKAPFHRSFRRWTGQTPQSYRRKQHGELALPLR